MATQKVWHEEFQDWVYEDPNIPKDLDFDDLGLDKIDISGCNLAKAMVPLSTLEGTYKHVKPNKS